MFGSLLSVLKRSSSLISQLSQVARLAAIERLLIRVAEGSPHAIARRQPIDEKNQTAATCGIVDPGMLMGNREVHPGFLDRFDPLAL